MPHLSIKHKITLLTVVIIAIFGSIASISTYYLTKQKLQQNATSQNQTISTHQASELNQAFTHIYYLTQTISQQPEIKTYFNNLTSNLNATPSANLTPILNRYQIGSSFAAIYLMDTTGLTHFSTDPSFVGKNYAFRTYFQQALSRQHSVDTAIGVTSNELGYYFAHHIANSDNKTIGVVVIKVNPDFISQIVDENSISYSGTILLTDSNGIIIYSNHNQYNYKSLTTLTESQQRYLNQTRRFENVTIESLNFDPISNIINTYSHPTTISLNIPQPHIFSVSKLNNYPFFIISFENSQSLLHASLENSLILALIVIFAAISATFFIFLFTSHLLKPLHQLQQVATAIASGNYQIKTNIQTHDELQTLSQSLSIMAQKIKMSQTNLQDQVDQKTQQLQQKLSELKKMNQLMVDREIKMTELKNKIAQLSANQPTNPPDQNTSPSSTQDPQAH